LFGAKRFRREDPHGDVAKRERASVKTNQTQQENLFVFVRARPDAVVSRLRVHDLIRIILHGTRDPLDAVKLIRPRRKCIRNRFVRSHF
jgi:hypothetical protein